MVGENKVGMELVNEISEYYGVSVDWLITGTDSGRKTKKNKVFSEDENDLFLLIRIIFSNSLFDETVLFDLQNQIKQNYQKVVEKNRFVFAEEPDEMNFGEYSGAEDVKCRGQIESDLFNVQEIENINADIQEKELEKAVKEAHKTMQLPYFENPKTDTEKLLNCQYLYIKKNDMNAYAEMLDLSFKVCKHLIWQYLKKHRDIFLDDISQDEKASIAMEYVLRRYKYNPGWYVHSNFVGALKGGVIHAMSYENTTDKNTITVENPIRERAKNIKTKNNKKTVL